MSAGRYVGPQSWVAGEDHAEVALLEALQDARRRHSEQIAERAFRRKHDVVPGPDAVDFEEWIARERSRVRDLVAALRVLRAVRSGPPARVDPDGWAVVTTDRAYAWAPLRVAGDDAEHAAVHAYARARQALP